MDHTKIQNILYRLLSKQFNFVKNVTLEDDRYNYGTKKPHQKIIIHIDPPQLQKDIFPNLELNHELINKNISTGYLDEVFVMLDEVQPYTISFESLIESLSQSLLINHEPYIIYQIK